MKMGMSRNYDPETKGGDAPDRRKVKATLHWVSAQHAFPAEIRLYDRLFEEPDPAHTEEGEDWKDNLNPGSLKMLQNCMLEPALKDRSPGFRCQFERKGYFCVDPDSGPDNPVFNRIVSLRDAWAKIQKRKQQEKQQKKKNKKQKKKK